MRAIRGLNEVSGLQGLAGMERVQVANILRGAVVCAIQAPSSHNTQPWRFRRRGDLLELWLDRRRHLDIVDPLRRQLTISLGCALFNARAAVRASGFLGDVHLVPDPAQPDLMAVLRLGLPRSATADDRDLVAAIPRRRTNRRPFLPRPISAEVSEQLGRAARAERTTMHRLWPAQKHLLAGLVAECDRRRFADPAYREQVSDWLVPAGRPRRDGIPFAEKEFGTTAWFGVRRIVDSPELGARFGALEEQRLNDAPLVAIFSTESNDPVDWLDCGHALQAVLLRATQLGISAAYVDQVLELADLRNRVSALTACDRIPQMVVRLGYAPPLEHSAPRRDLSEVLEEVD